MLALIVLLLFTMGACLHLRDSNRQVMKKFKSAGYHVEARDIKTIFDRNLHYIQTGRADANAPVLFFIHGSPGASNNFNDNLLDSQLQSKYLMVSVDRPGFGYSNFGKSIPILSGQAEYLEPLLALFKGRRVILVGHSYGGPLAVKMAIKYPEWVHGLVLVAASVDPELEPDEWWRRPADTWFGRLLIPKIMEVSNQEIITLKQDLIAMDPEWVAVTQPTVVIQGLKDKLVPPGNADFAEKHLVNSKWVKVERIPDMNHFIPFTRSELITGAILNLNSASH